ncbi:hypothetical protein [Foetidibacter luteolus]|uniref:hypothetical protein n=1 Tax=Foetidibacter luteolus TaxID=2608880 RepID=UPI00129BA22B|nr:hypothetical protein [Foetidibacter luteolus]
MMKIDTQERWLFLSIFYPQHQWHDLLLKGLYPFFNSSPPGLKDYLIHFGTNKGDHVGLSCLVSAGQCGAFISRFNDFFTGYFQSIPGLKSYNDELATTEQVYMNIPFNTLCHSLHQFLPQAATGDRAAYRYLWSQSTKQLYLAFETDPFDLEDLFSASLYLTLLVLLDGGVDARAYTHELGKMVEMDAVRGGYDQRYKEAGGMLNEIYEDCLSIIRGSPNPRLKAIADWSLLFRNYCALGPNLPMLLSHLYFHLGIPVNGRGIISYFTQQLMKTHFQKSASYNGF